MLIYDPANTNGLPQQTPNGMSPAPLGGVGVSTTQLNPMTGMPFTQQQLQSVFGAPSKGGMGGLFSGALTNLAQTPAFQTLGQVAMGQPQQVPEWIQLAMQSGQMNNPYMPVGGQQLAAPNPYQTTDSMRIQGLTPEQIRAMSATPLGGQPTNQPISLSQALANLNRVNPGAINPAIVNPVRPTPAAPVNLAQVLQAMNTQNRPPRSTATSSNTRKKNNAIKFSTGMR